MVSNSFRLRHREELTGTPRAPQVRKLGSLCLRAALLPIALVSDGGDRACLAWSLSILPKDRQLYVYFYKYL